MSAMSLSLPAPGYKWQTGTVLEHDSWAGFILACVVRVKKWKRSEIYT